jgi:hypothetical protein
VDRVGPGDYNPSVDAVKVEHGRKAAGWSHSKTAQHKVFEGKDSPGPGHYYEPQSEATEAMTDALAEGAVNFRTAGAKAEGRIMKKRSSNFASKVPRPFQTVAQPYDVSPGPGTYAIVDAKNAGALTRPPPEHQFFGTSARRNYQVRAQPPARRLSSKGWRC